MVDFCPICSSILRNSINDGVPILVCRCGHKQKKQEDSNEVQKKIQEKKAALSENLIVVSDADKISVNPIVTRLCPKCKHNKAEAWQEQTRSADEPSTSFFRCTNCKNTWREY